MLLFMYGNIKAKKQGNVYALLKVIPVTNTNIIIVARKNRISSGSYLFKITYKVSWLAGESILMFFFKYFTAGIKALGGNLKLFSCVYKVVYSDTISVECKCKCLRCL